MSDRKRKVYAKIKGVEKRIDPKTGFPVGQEGQGFSEAQKAEREKAYLVNTGQLEIKPEPVEKPKPRRRRRRKKADE